MPQTSKTTATTTTQPRIREKVQRFDRISRTPDDSRAPPLPPQPYRLRVQSTTPSPSLSNESTHFETSLPTNGNRTQPFAKPPGPARKKVTGLENPLVSNVAELTFPKKIPVASPPPVPPKTRRRSSTRTYGEDNTSFDVYEQEDRDETDVYPPSSSKQYVLSPRQPSRERSQHFAHRSRPDDESFARRSISPKQPDNESIGLEIPESAIMVPRVVSAYVQRPPVSRKASTIEPYGATDIHHIREEKYVSSSSPSGVKASNPSAFAPVGQTPSTDDSTVYQSKRSLPIGNFMMELGALIIVFIIAMVLVLAIRAEQTTLRTIMQLSYSYAYLVSIVWMIWCTVDISRFRRQWMKIANQNEHEDYMSILERNTNKIFYFPSLHNTGGLFMRAGAGMLCMGSLILTIIEVAKSIVMVGHEPTTRNAISVNYSTIVLVSKAILYILRFFFHCIQFLFLFRYGNIVINRYFNVAQIGLIHVVIANFCTWFEAIVFETSEQMHKYAETESLELSTRASRTIVNGSTALLTNLFRTGSTGNNGGHEDNQTVLEWIEEIEETLSVYLYPCLIEYSLISLTVFFIMWKNIGKKEGNSYLRFGDRHIFTVNCARASRGLLFGGMILIVTILTLVPIYILENGAQVVTQITELVLIVVSFILVSTALLHTSRLHYEAHAHVDIFDQVLIIITTVGDFAYALFGLLASIFTDPDDDFKPIFIRIEISIGVLAILQTFLQTGFILDALKRRTRTKDDVRNKPGREAVTALLLTNLAIWLHDSLSAKKVRLNPFQVNYYDAGTWAIIQAFTSPLSIFYRFHSSVCLADIWQEAYDDCNAQERSRMTGKKGMQSIPLTDSDHFHRL